MFGNNLTVESELRYMIQWFNEWSELQREDFLPILAEYLSKESPEICMNGIVAGVAAASCDQKPMSLFQCRIKLFKEWSPKWPELIKSKLQEKIIEIDPVFGQKLQDELSPVVTNGTSSPSAAVQSNEDQPVTEEEQTIEEEEVTLNS